MKNIKLLLSGVCIGLCACAVSNDTKFPPNTLKDQEITSVQSKDDPPEQPIPAWEGTCEGKNSNGETHYYTTIGFTRGKAFSDISKHIQDNPDETHFPRIDFMPL